MKLKDLLAGLELLGGNADPEQEITGVSYDSRKTRPGDLFVAMTGYAAEVQTNNDYSFTLRFRGATTELVQLDQSSLADAIELIKPAHLRFIISGLTWYALESVGMTWQQIEDAEYTWDQFEGLTPVYGSDD